MRRRNRASACAAALLILGVLLSAPARAQTDPDADAGFKNPAPQIFDALILRPFSFCVTLVGSVLFVPVAIITSPGGRDSLEEGLDLLVLTPGKYTFTRPLGDF